MIRRIPMVISTSFNRLPLCAAMLFAAAQMGTAQSSILNTNLIVNGNAESGSAGTPTTLVASIPGWTRTGNANVLAYSLTGYLLLTNPAPPDHGFQYFYSGDVGAGASTLTQTIDVSSGASVISGGNVKFTASAYLGGLEGGPYSGQIAIAFQNAAGQTFSQVTLGPVAPGGTNGMFLQQQIGLVPTGTAHITVTMSFAGRYVAADSLSLVLSTLGTSPGSVLGTNLVVNPGAEAGPSAPSTGVALYIPGWSTINDLSVAPYGGTGWIQLTDPGPVDRGVNLFSKVVPNDTYMSQDIDVSAAASLIDASQVTYAVSAWLGGLGGVSPTLNYTFFDWSGNQLAATGQLGPVSHTVTGLFEKSNSGTLPHGTRRVNITLNFLAGTLDAMADNIAFTLGAPSGPPVINPGGIVSASAFGGSSSISPGSWIEIYGTDLAPAAGFWSFTNGVANSVSGISVSVGGKAAFVEYVTPGQIDALVSSDAPTGAEPVTVTSANGTSDKFWLVVNPTAPGLLAPSSFVISGKQYVAALFADNATFALPVNAIPGVPSRPATAGDVLTIYGVGFGPVSGGFTAGTLVTGQNSITTPIQFTFGTTAATLTYEGLAPSLTGLYQFNVVVPKVAANSATPISFTLGGAKGTQTLYIATQ